MKDQKQKVKCPGSIKDKCGYVFETKSKLKFITCSSCRLKFNREENRVRGE